MWPEAPVRVAIVGCGQIGSRWDASAAGLADRAAPSLTHAAAFTRHPLAQVVAFCDADLARAEQACVQWQVPGQAAPSAHQQVSQMLQAVPADLLVVATASAVRSAVVGAALAAGIRTLVIEKPLATTMDESQRLVQALDEAGAQALVNYLRHWDAGMQALRLRRARGDLGPLQRLLGVYGKGLANNGSHLIDLAGLLCDARPVRARALGAPLPASEAAWSQGADSAIDAQVELTAADGRMLLLDLRATDATAFSCFELRLLGRDALVDITRGGRRIEWTPIVDDPHFAGYRVPGEPERQADGLLQAMDGMADEAVRLARGQVAHASCSAHDALRTAATVQAIRQSQQAGGAWTALPQPAPPQPSTPQPLSKLALSDQ